MGKLLKNKSIVTLVSIVVCIIILWAAYNYRVNKVKTMVEIPVARLELPPRTQLTSENVTSISVASALLEGNIIRNKNLILKADTPLYVNYNTFVPKGGLFFNSTVVKWSNMPDSAWADIDDTYSVVSLPISSNAGANLYASTIFPGDKIDIYASYTGFDDTLVYGPLFASVTVLAVKDSDGNHIFKKGPEQQQVQALLFALNNGNDGSENQFLLFQKAKALGLVLTPVPRNANYTKDESKTIKVASDTIVNYIISLAPNIETNAIENVEVEEIKTID